MKEAEIVELEVLGMLSRALFEKSALACLTGMGNDKEGLASDSCVRKDGLQILVCVAVGRQIVRATIEALKGVAEVVGPKVGGRVTFFEKDPNGGA